VKRSKSTGSCKVSFLIEEGLWEHIGSLISTIESLEKDNLLLRHDREEGILAAPTKPNVSELDNAPELHAAEASIVTPTNGARVEVPHKVQNSTDTSVEELDRSSAINSIYPPAGGSTESLSPEQQIIQMQHDRILALLPLPAEPFKESQMQAITESIDNVLSFFVRDSQLCIHPHLNRLIATINIFKSTNNCISD
jgi:hypothetical protein